MTVDNGEGARAYAAPLPEARRLRRALESLGATVHRGRPGSPPIGEADAPIMAGMLRALTETYEAGVLGTEAQTAYQFGRLAVYDHDERRVLSALALQLRAAAGFSHQAIDKVPQAARQLRIATLALECATWAVAAAAEIAGYDNEADLAAAGEMSGKAVDYAGALHKFMTHLDEHAAAHYAAQDADKKPGDDTGDTEGGHQ
jgi:hypothetical protein